MISALVRRGRLEDAEALGAEMPPDDELSRLYSGLFAFNRRAELYMAQRRARDAVAELRRLDAVVRAFGWERFCQGYGRQLLARALVFSGEREEGLALARSEVASADARAIPGARAQALISLGHAVDGAEALEAFTAAAEVAAAGASLWVRATAAFELGAALRRDGRRTDARRLLTDARDLAQRTDSTLLVDAASAELLVAGGRPRRTRVSGVEALTASERRVAEHAAAGMSNREIAEALFVTRKTVELHLGNTFGKLGIRSRTEIAGILAGDEDPGTR
jgi:DNA-binding CsgD family transcriptional regulator